MSDIELKAVNMTRKEWDEYKDLRRKHFKLKADQKKYKTNTNKVR
jgi:hypothetical protein